MKNWQTTIVTIFMVASFISCRKGFLDKNPLDQVSETTFWKTQADAEKALTGVYQKMHGYNYYGYIKIYLDAITDNAYNQYNFDNTADIGLGNGSPTSSMPSILWARSYQLISATNIFLTNVENVQMAENIKQQYKAEATFLRAFAYFHLVTIFGGVPLYTTQPNVETAKVSRSSKDSVLLQIYADLEFAIENLPGVSYTGHAVQGSALALKAKVKLFNEEWAEAAEAASAVMALGQFSLYEDYGRVFLKKYQPNNPEILFSTQYQAPTILHNGNFRGMDLEMGSWAAVAPYQEMVDEYEMVNGQAITDATSGYNPANPFIDRDPRLKMSIKLPGHEWMADGAIFSTSPSPTTYQAYKYVDTTLLPINYGDIDKEDADIIHLRYADVLLMYAEAKNELSGPDNSVYDALDLIRSRAGIALVDRIKYSTQASLRDYIRHERRIELAFEGHRFFDIVRWEIAEAVMPAVKHPANIPVSFASKNYLLPIPQSELDVNPYLVQNPGY